MVRAHEHAGPESIVDTFVDVGRYWEVITFEPEAVFCSGEYAAVFGRFTYRSKGMSKLVTTPFAVFAKVKDGRCYFLQFMEETLATSAWFSSGGQWRFRSNPDVGEVAFWAAKDEPSWPPLHVIVWRRRRRPPALRTIAGKVFSKSTTTRPRVSAST